MTQFVPPPKDKKKKDKDDDGGEDDDVSCSRGHNAEEKRMWGN